MIIPKEIRDEYFEKAQKSLTDRQTIEDVWDPTGKIPTKEELIRLNTKIKAQQIYIEENLDEIIKKRRKKNTLNSILIPLTIIFFFILEPLVYLGIIGLLLVNIFLNTKNIDKVKKDIIKIELAQKNNYLYDPEENLQRYDEYKQKFP